MSEDEEDRINKINKLRIGFSERRTFQGNS
jgi:hypothetical protein